MNKAELLQKAKSILFSTEMVNAILARRKTQTRRIIKPQPKGEYLGYCKNSIFKENIGMFIFGYNDCAKDYARPRYKKDDILYVRETWGRWEDDICAEGGYSNPIYTIYKADDPENNIGVKWKPSIHMPKVAARLFLRVTDVRAERLQDISASDALKEGIVNDFATCIISLNAEADNIIADFRKLWDKLNAKRGYGWEANPWVFVYSFKRIVPGTEGEG